MSSAETAKVAASTSIATGAVTAWISPPATAGPATKDADRVPLSRLFASTNWSRRTSPTKKLGYDVW